MHLLTLSTVKQRFSSLPPRSVQSGSQDLLSKFIPVFRVVAFMLRLCSPIKSTWLGGAYLAANPTALKAAQVTREEYNEYGHGWLAKVFSGAVRR